MSDKQSPQLPAAISNGKQPARPILNNQPGNSLTKREELAARILAGLAANSHSSVWEMSAREWARTSVRCADELLIALEEVRPGQ